MDYQSIKNIILQLLQNTLPEYLYYHSVEHIVDVMQAVENIAQQEGVKGDNLILLKTAALFHDTGFLFGANEHEAKSCEIAQSYLPQYGYNASQISLINGMIMATKIPQQPQTHLEQILADADLDYLGRDDFFEIGNQLFKELSYFNIIESEKEWNELQVRFLENHRYHTATSINNRNPKKQDHLAIIKAKLASN